MHVVLGPHYAKRQWRDHPRVILLDRCYYRGDPEHVSLGWMRPDGGRDWWVGEGRSPPVIMNEAGERGTIFLCDHSAASVSGHYDAIRMHPTHSPAPEMALEDQLRHFAKAVGLRTSALVTAALMGLEVESCWPPHILNHDNWLRILPYADWSEDEIAAGDAWAHLCEAEAHR